MQGGCSRAEGDGVLRVHPRRKRLLEFIDFWTTGKPGGPQDVDDRLDVVFINRLPTIWKEGIANWRSSVDCEKLRSWASRAHSARLYRNRGVVGFQGGNQFLQLEMGEPIRVGVARITETIRQRSSLYPVVSIP